MCRSGCNRQRSRAEEKARADEATKRARVERDRTRLTIALAAALFGLIVLGGGGSVYLGQLQAASKAATEQIVTQEIDEANLLRGQAKAAAVGDLSKWPAAVAAAKRAQSQVTAGKADGVLQMRVEALVALLKTERADAAHRATEADKDRRFLKQLESVRLGRAELSLWSRSSQTDLSYAKAFRDFGVDPDQLDPIEAGRLLSDRSKPLELAFFLDDWALARRQNRDKKDSASWQRSL